MLAVSVNTNTWRKFQWRPILKISKQHFEDKNVLKIFLDVDKP
jgi:hypothetical protein